ncbi:ArsR family transcriptional regulator [Serratia plymuthica]|uniref:ArsR/SmtB family transcription factor n=1 Tax=Serratia plymuthica TaxID=82996 RepID=UPI0019267D2C|nr:helix-turn-helix transcriptional regulator [Serratia plymuthica]MBL3523319.1 helix-turn-helix transcriptional regulator [Serratia plymuthica]MEB6538583.1 ArsR family transcriptional regulator [Serratia plymuthica]
MGQHNIASVAHLIAEPVRAVMLIALADGNALSASALAEAAGVTPQTASSHLAKLLDGGLLSVEQIGRYRYYRLSGPHVSHLLESLASIGPVTPAWRNTPNRSAREMRFARCCYDHLAGKVGVAVTRSLLKQGLIVENGACEYVLTPAGANWLQALGAEAAAVEPEGVGKGRQCLDWTERQYHLAGPLAAYLLDAFCHWGWLQRLPATRALKVTSRGWTALKTHLAVERADLEDDAVNGEAAYPVV